jgi:hypothetical protein
MSSHDVTPADGLPPATTAGVGDRWRRLMVAAGALGILVYMTFEAFGFSTEPRRTPLVVGVPATIMALVLVWREARGTEPVKAAEESAAPPAETVTGDRGSPPQGEEAAQAASDGDALSTLGAAVWIAVLAAMFLLFGFLVTTLAFPPLFMSIYGRESWRTIVVTTVTVFVLTYVFFVVLLEVQLYRGVVTIPVLDGLL